MHVDNKLYLIETGYLYNTHTTFYLSDDAKLLQLFKFITFPDGVSPTDANEF